MYGLSVIASVTPSTTSKTINKMKKVMAFQSIKIMCEMIMIDNRYVAKTLSKALKRLWSVLLWYFVVIMWTEEFGQSLFNKDLRLALFIKQSLIFWMVVPV